MTLNLNSFIDSSMPRVFFKNITINSVPIQPPAVYGQPISDTYNNVSLEVESFIVIDSEMERTIRENKLLNVYYLAISNANPEFENNLLNGKYYFDQFNIMVKMSNGSVIPSIPTVSGKIPATDIYLKTINAELFLSDSESDFEHDSEYDSGLSEYNNLFFKDSIFKMYKYNFSMNCSVKKRDKLFLVGMTVGQEPEVVETTKFFDTIRQIYGPVCAELVMNNNMKIPNQGIANYSTETQTGMVWAGSTHKHQQQLMSGMLHTELPHSNLTSNTSLSVFKILDAREELERNIQLPNGGPDKTLFYPYVKEQIELPDPSGMQLQQDTIRY